MVGSLFQTQTRVLLFRRIWVIRDEQRRIPADDVTQRRLFACLKPGYPARVERLGTERIKRLVNDLLGRACRRGLSAVVDMRGHVHGRFLRGADFEVRPG